MPHRQANRLLVLTLMLEQAVEAEDWPEIKSLLTARSDAIEKLGPDSFAVAQEIADVEERVLTMLRKRLELVRADMRNLSTALRIAAPYMKTAGTPSFSLAG